MTGGARHKRGPVVRLAEGGAKNVVGNGGGGGGGETGRACAQEVGSESVGEVQGEALEGPLLGCGGVVCLAEAGWADGA